MTRYAGTIKPRTSSDSRLPQGVRAPRNLLISKTFLSFATFRNNNTTDTGHKFAKTAGFLYRGDGFTGEGIHPPEVSGMD
jgi:hypothetical protein